MPLTRAQAFELWAPSSSPWSAWAKPVLFAHLPHVLDLAPSPAPAPDVSSWAPSADGRSIVVVDLPGARSVRIGEALIGAGFRPVPLFNAVPGPIEGATAPEDEPRTLVDVRSIVDA